ncbi:hypothetical protein TSUD_278070 [Trifolium subterraneum]|uniref:Uncharacterized protein n=1 Tax=Trifolium subterraneum TaxID=3900 RepID=A0A2Z6NQK3_TRISU|nr:hypothetical protein TSUD_278070 [Trifolium subterraneum]
MIPINALFVEVPALLPVSLPSFKSTSVVFRDVQFPSISFNFLSKVLIFAQFHLHQSNSLLLLQPSIQLFVVLIVTKILHSCSSFLPLHRFTELFIELMSHRFTDVDFLAPFT